MVTAFAYALYHFLLGYIYYYAKIDHPVSTINSKKLPILWIIFA